MATLKKILLVDDDDDLRGVYVLGEPQLLAFHLAQGRDEPAVEAETYTMAGVVKAILQAAAGHCG